MVKHSNKIIILSSTITMLSLLSVSSASALTYQDEIDMQFTFNPTVSINVTGDLTIPDLAPGSYADSNIITVTAGSNDAHGYTLYSTVGSSSSNYTDLRLSPSNTTNKFTSIGVDTVKTTLASFSDDTWGYSYCLTTNNCDTGSNYWVGGNSDSASTGYKGLPIYDASDNTTGVILASTTTPSETELKFKIGAKASSTQVSGTYTNIINFIGIGKVVTTTYNLTYNANAGSDTVTGMPTNLTSQTTNDGVIALSTATPTRSGYIFKGWCTDGSSETSCSGTLYEPGRTYIIPAASQGGIAAANLYAIWEAPTPSKIYMQDYTLAQCATDAVDFSITLYDKRDENDYTVRYINGNCWMTSNLRISGGSLMTTEESDVAFAYTIPNTSLADNSGSFTEGQIQSGLDGLGNPTMWYNYCAATAGTVCQEGRYTAEHSICPANWRIPSLDDAAQGLPGTEFQTTTGGSYRNGTLQGQSEGWWWLNTPHNTQNGISYSLLAGANFDSAFPVGAQGARYFGFYVRCVARS